MSKRSLEKYNDVQGDKVIRATFALAAVAFAGFLVIANSKPFSVDARIATEYFAAGIPLTVGLSVAPRITMPKRGETFKSKVINFVARAAHEIVFFCGPVLCLVGIYWLFRHVSHEAAELFASMSVLTLMLVVAVDERESDIEEKRADPPEDIC